MSTPTNVITHEIDGIEVEPSIDDGQAKIILRQNSRNSRLAPIIETNTLSFGHEIAEQFNARIANGGTGMTEGPIYSRKITSNGTTIEFDKLVLDLHGENIIWSCESIKNIPSFPYEGDKWIFELAQTVFFQDLDLKSEYKQLPYVINTIPNYVEAAIATITAFIVIDKMNDIAKEIFKVIAEIASILGAIGALIKIVIVIAWAIILLAQIIVFITDIFDHLIQPIKYHALMNWRRQVEIGFKEIGLGFESTLFDDEFIKNVYYLPAKQQSAKDIENAFSLGFTIPESTRTNGEYQKGFDNLLIFTMEYFDARIDVIDGVAHMETRGTQTIEPTSELPNLENLPKDPHRTNLNEVYNSRYIVSFLTDLSEENTIDNYKGTATHAITRPKDVDDKKAILGGNTVQRNLDVSRVSTKLEFTAVEEKLDILFRDYSEETNKVIGAANQVTAARNTIISAVEKVVKKLDVVGIDVPFNPKPIPQLNPVNPEEIPNRKGMAMFSKDNFLVDKLVGLDIASSPLNTKIRKDNTEKIHSEFVYSKYHFRQSIEVTKESPFGNQAFIYNHPEFHLCKEAAKEIIDNKYIFTFNKRETVKVRECEWLAEKGIAAIEIEIPTLITDNYETELITADGL